MIFSYSRGLFWILLEFFQIVVNTLGFSGIRSDLSNQLEFRVLSYSFVFVQIFPNSLAFFWILSNSFVYPWRLSYLLEFFTISRIFSYSLRLFRILLDSPKSARNLGGFSRILWYSAGRIISSFLEFFRSRRNFFRFCHILSDLFGFSRIISNFLGFSQVVSSFLGFFRFVSDFFRLFQILLSLHKIWSDSF